MITWLKKILSGPQQPQSSEIAKERLMVIVAHERGAHEQQPDFLPLLQKELTTVIAKYVKIDADHVQVEFEQKGGRSVLELNITLPDGQALSPVLSPIVAKSKNIGSPDKATLLPPKKTSSTGAHRKSGRSRKKPSEDSSKKR